jgi:2-polyprenyl-6-hydroxyphenyl methylase/3-demethylubiquinone-9 3-methyltransferase
VTRTDVQKLYTVMGGRWWDPFRAQWELIWARNAVRDLDSLLRRYVTPEARILDVGCGTGANLARLRRLGLAFGHYTGVDFSPSMLALARKRFGDPPGALPVGVTLRQGDATALEDTGERYDVIVSTYLLDHLSEPAAFVNGVQRFLAPDGRLLVLFYSRPRWFVRFWMSPIGRIVRATPVSEQEVSRFTNVRAKRSYGAGVVTVVDIGSS